MEGKEKERVSLVSQTVAQPQVSPNQIAALPINRYTPCHIPAQSSTGTAE